MRRNTDNNLLKNLTLTTALVICSPLVKAEVIDCSAKNSTGICAKSLQESRQKLSNHYLTALLVSDAPIRLLQDTQNLWLNRAKQCKQASCYLQQIDLRIDDLNVYTSLNQTLTQHYLKFEKGQPAQQGVHLKLHQLGKDSIKIEGIAYRSPNNRLETQAVNFLAYTTPQDKTEIIDNEHDCKYRFSYSKALLVVTSQQQGCERFNGTYRLYD